MHCITNWPFMMTLMTKVLRITNKQNCCTHTIMRSYVQKISFSAKFMYAVQHWFRFFASRIIFKISTLTPYFAARRRYKKFNRINNGHFTVYRPVIYDFSSRCSKVRPMKKNFNGNYEFAFKYLNQYLIQHYNFNCIELYCSSNTIWIC